MYFNYNLCINFFQVPKFNFPIYKVPRRGDEVSKRPGIYKEIEEDVEEEKPQAVINVNTLVEPERNRKNFFENFDKNERIEEEKDDHWLFDVPIRHDTETDENYNKIILAPMFLVFCALIDFAVDSFTV